MPNWPKSYRAAFDAHDLAFQALVKFSDTCQLSSSPKLSREDAQTISDLALTVDKLQARIRIYRKRKPRAKVKAARARVTSPTLAPSPGATPADEPSPAPAPPGS